MVKTTTRVLKDVGYTTQKRGNVVVYLPSVERKNVLIYVLMVIVGLLRVCPLARANINLRQMRKGIDVRENHAINMQISNYLKNNVVSP